MNVDIARIGKGKTHRGFSYDIMGRNQDAWFIGPGETKVLADITSPSLIMHIWMTQRHHYREAVLKITWDDAAYPRVVCPLGDMLGWATVY